MVRALKKISPHATNAKLKSLLEKSPDRITRHTEMLKTLIEGQGGTVSKEPCKGMEGLVAESIKHTIDEAPKKGAVVDAAIMAQYQRMTHYGITGFGTVAAFARALKAGRDNDKLETAVKDIHRCTFSSREPGSSEAWRLLRGGVPGPSPIRVLIVDDYADIAESLALVLDATLLSAVVSEIASDGAQALTSAMRRRPDVVIMDIDMPVMNGIDAAKALRTAFRTSTPVLIGMTGNVMNLAAMESHLTFDHLFSKPVDIDRLIKILIAEVDV